MENNQQWIIIGASLAGLAVILGAFGAHALETRLNAEDLSTYETAVRYQMYHGLALLLVATLHESLKSELVSYIGYSFLTGVIIFSGSLYLLVLTNTRWLGAITPIGGVAFIAGWGLLIYATVSR